MLSDALDRFYLERNRDNYIKMSECIRTTFGEETMAKTMAEDVKNSKSKLIVIGNARRLDDVKYLSQLSGFTLIKIDMDSKTRYERLIKRNEKSDDQNKTYEQFLEDDKRSTEVSVKAVANKATETIDNNDTFDELYSQLDKLIDKYYGKS